MTVKARVVGSREDLGTLSEDGLDFFGHRLTRDWSEIEPNDEALRKLRGNRHVELSGDPGPAPKAAAAPKAKPEAPTSEEDAVRAELAELGVEPKPGASLKVLKMALGKARKAKAAADAEG